LQQAQQITLSPECRAKQQPPQQAAAGRTTLAGIVQAISAKRAVKILAIGSSSTVGIGATSSRASYPIRLEDMLEAHFKGKDIDVIGRGVSGEAAEAAAERMRFEVAEIRPDLVLWQVGTNDALARIEIEEFGEVVRETLAWLRSNHIDVVLIDPQYIEQLAQDEHYVKIVDTIEKIADEAKVPLVSRFDLMQALATQSGNGSYLAKDHLHLNDLGYRCMAEHVARAIVSAVVIDSGAQKQATPATHQAGAAK
jgi:lysophospholipase L1-like esterase